MSCSGPGGSFPPLPNNDPKVVVDWAGEAFAAIADISELYNLAQFNFGAIAAAPCVGFTHPAVPAPRDLSYTVPSAPSAVALTPPDAWSTGDLPEFVETLSIDTSGHPGAAPVDTFGDAPRMTVPTFPLAPDYTTPAVPTIDGIVIPEFGSVATIDTTITLPVTAFPAIRDGIDFTNVLWTSANLDDMAAHMARVRGGDFAISTTIWRQIYDRAAMALRREAVARERAGRRAWARQGWMMPGGVALAQQELAAHDINESTSAKALEVAVQEAVQKSDEFWKAMTHGAALEGMYQKAHETFYELGLRFAVAVQAASIAVHNAYVARYQVEVAVVQATIESVRMKLENERMKLEGHKLVIDAALARGEADKLELQLYIAQWNGIQSMIAAYSAELDAVKTNLESQKLLLDGHNANLQGYSVRVDAWAKGWDGYTAKMQGEGVKATAFDSYVKAYVGRIQGYNADVQRETARIQSQTEYAKIQAMAVELDVSRFKAQWDGISAQIDGVAKLTAADADIYSAQVQGSAAASQAATECSKVSIEAQRVTMMSQIEAAKLWVEQAVESMKLAQTAQIALGNIYAQIGAAQLSQFNYSTSSSNSNSSSITCSESYSESTSDNKSEIRSCDC